MKVFPTPQKEVVQVAVAKVAEEPPQVLGNINTNMNILMYIMYQTVSRLN